MSNDLRLRVLMNLVENVTRPLRNMTSGSTEAAGALRTTRDRLRQLNDSQRDIGAFRQLRNGMSATATEVAQARQRVAELGRQLNANGPPTQEMVRDFNRARQAAKALADQQRQQHIQLAQLRTRLAGAGIDTRNLSQHERDLRSNIRSTTAEMERQQRALAELAARQRRLSEARERMGATRELGGNLAGAGATVGVAGAAMGAALTVPVAAFAKAEDSATSLAVAMMRSGGQVSPEFEKINALAMQMGDRLPGTTSDFQDLMTMLVRSGISSQAILGGMGEATAYLAVQLKKAPDEAAEFAAKLQDATKTSEKDMLSLMDVIQKAFYLGVDDNNLLNGLAKLGPAMDTIKQSGLEGTKALTPLLIMADQAGMQGEAAGNAFRKIFQMGLDTKKIDAVNKLLDPKKRLNFTSGKGEAQRINFSDGKGEFGGLDKMFAQFEKLKGLTTERRLTVLKALYGDDAETLQAVSLMMEKGKAGYAEVQAKMAAQASLQQRVNRQLGTLKNLWEAAEGTFTNSMVAFGEAIAPELKATTEWLGSMAQSLGAWAKANPVAANAMMKTAAIMAILLTAIGAILVVLGAVLGPLAFLKFSLVTLGIQTGIFAKTLALMGGGLRMAGQAILFLGRALLMNPIGLAVTAIALAAYAIYTHWEPIKSFFVGLWASIKMTFDGALSWFASLPAKFSMFGTNMVDGLVNGITSRIGAVKEAVESMGGGAVTWFKEKLGIRSPSRVFGVLGGYVGEGAAIGMEKETGRISAAAAALATAATLAFNPAAAQPFDASGAAGGANSPFTSAAAQPFKFGGGAGAGGAAAAGAPGAAAGGPVTINIYPPPGMDAAAIGRAVAAELDRRERSKQARIGSRLSD